MFCFKFFISGYTYVIKNIKNEPKIVGKPVSKHMQDCPWASSLRFSRFMPFRLAPFHFNAGILLDPVNAYACM